MMKNVVYFTLKALFVLKNIFVEKSYSKCAGESIPGPLSKKTNLRISLYRQCKMNSLFLLYANLRAIEIYWNQAVNHLLLPNIKLFFYKKKYRS